MYKLRNITSKDNAITETEGYAVFFTEDGARDVIFIYRDTSRDYFTLAYGIRLRFSFEFMFRTHPPFQVTPKTLIGNSSLFLEAMYSMSGEVVHQIG